MSTTLLNVVEQRKTVSVVFADLVDSTTLAERLDPELLSGILRRYFDALRTVVEAHGGTVEKYIGDAVVGVFGVPVLHEDDALRAVRAALAMHRVIRELSAQLPPELGVDLRIRVGVNTGEVLVSGDNALGHAISMAARLEQNAAAGETLVGRETFGLIAPFIEAEEVESLKVKGSIEPIAAWRVTAVRDVVPRGSVATAGYVGRERELAAIASAFDSAVAEAACITLTVIAPPGLGKSRLLAEGTRRVGDRARVLVGRCLPYGESITYTPLVEAIAQLEQQEGSDAVGRVMAGHSDAEQVSARVRATIDGAGGGSPDETAWAFRRLFDTLAADRPLVLILDDLHWADALLLDLIEYVATFSVGRPILLLCAARPDLFDVRPGWSAQRPNAQQVRLAPLTPEETEGLLAGIDGDRLDADARRRIVASSGGVPLFAEQMAALDADVRGHGDVPPTIRALLAARVDHLGPDERAVLEYAAIEGPVFHRETLVELMPADVRTSVGSQLLNLIRRDFVRPEQTADGRDAFSFNHALIRDAVYDAMSRRVRAELHESYAGILEATGGAADEVIGHHLEAAYQERLALGEPNTATSDLARRAGIALAAGGRQAAARKESTRAAALLTRAAQLLANDSAARITVLPDLIKSLVEMPDVAAARLAHVDAVSAARALDDRASELRAEMAWAMTEPHGDVTGWQPRLFELIDQAIDYFGPRGDDGNIARALLLKGLALGASDYDSAVVALKQAQIHAQRTDELSTQVEIWDELGGAMLFGSAPYDEVLKVTRSEIEWAREHGIAFAVADGRLGEAYSLAALGEFDAALTLLDELIEFFAQLPSLVPQHGECHTLAGRIERDRGNPAAAELRYRRAMELFEKSGHRRWWRNAAPGVAHALLDLGRLDDAREVLAEIRDHPATIDGAPNAFRLEAEARYRADTGDVDGAVDLARKAVAAVTGQRGIQYEGRARETLATMLAKAGDSSGAKQEYERARDLFSRKGYQPGLERVDRRLASVG